MFNLLIHFEMSTIKKFEDLECWQLARELSRKIYQLTIKEKFSKDFSLVNQIRNSSGSVMDNIAEGFERGGNKEFSQFLSISQGSAGEIKSQLYRALDQNYIDIDEFNDTYNLATRTGKAITGLMNYLKDSQMKGFKYF
jgi:four helix bundle protein